MFSPKSPCGFINLFQRFVATFCSENFSFPRWISVAPRHSLGKRCPWPGGEKGDLSPGEVKICVIFLLDSSMVFVFLPLFFGSGCCSYFSILDEYLGNRCYLGWITSAEKTIQNGYSRSCDQNERHTIMFLQLPHFCQRLPGVTE